MGIDHIPDAVLQEYSVGRLEEPFVGQIEEHLLTCEQCRNKVTEFDDAWGLNG